jgi:phage host-nuclease inhibitor protein Gam
MGGDEPMNIEEILFGEAPEKFEINDDNSLAWALRKIRQAEEEIAKAEKKREEWIKKINEWFGDETTPHVKTIEYMKTLVHDYMIRTGKKTVKHPLGTVRTRKTTRLEVVDETRFLAWAKESGNDQFIRVKEEVDKKELKKNIAPGTIGGAFYLGTGEEIPGVIAQAEEKTSIDIKEEEG